MKNHKNTKREKLQDLARKGQKEIEKRKLQKRRKRAALERKWRQEIILLDYLANRDPLGYNNLNPWLPNDIWLLQE